MRRNGFVDSVTLTSLRVDDVPSLGLTSKAEECVLRKVLQELHSREALRVDVGENSAGASRCVLYVNNDSLQAICKVYM